MLARLKNTLRQTRTHGPTALARSAARLEAAALLASTLGLLDKKTLTDAEEHIVMSGAPSGKHTPAHSTGGATLQIAQEVHRSPALCFFPSCPPSLGACLQLMQPLKGRQRQTDPRSLRG